MSQENELLRKILGVQERLLEELTLLRESQKPATFPLVAMWNTWIGNRRLGPLKAIEEAAKKQAAAKASLSANPLPAKTFIVHQDPNAGVDREAPAFLETVH